MAPPAATARAARFVAGRRVLSRSVACWNAAVTMSLAMATRPPSRTFSALNQWVKRGMRRWHQRGELSPRSRVELTRRRSAGRRAGCRSCHAREARRDEERQHGNAPAWQQTARSTSAADEGIMSSAWQLGDGRGGSREARRWARLRDVRASAPERPRHAYTGRVRTSLIEAADRDSGDHARPGR